MKYNKIVLAGGNGYLGRVLAEYYKPLANEIIILSRKEKDANGNIQTVLWDGRSEGEWIKSLNGADLLINLCGKNVNCRYTEENKAEIINSRTIPTALLGSVIAEMEKPPKLWINVTSATIYRHAEDRPQDEETGADSQLMFVANGRKPSLIPIRLIPGRLHCEWALCLVAKTQLSPVCLTS